MKLQSQIIPVPIPQETVQELNPIPWCHSILSSPKKYIPIRTPSREPKSNTEDTLIANTLATNNTFQTWQSFYKPYPYQPDSSSQKSGELIYIIKFGSYANGHANTLHGGAISLLLDEILGMIAILHSTPGIPIYTAFLHTSFKKPISTPGVVLCRAWMVEEKTGGRKYWTRGTIEDGFGGVYAEGEALMVGVEGPKL